jgi:hypothetical protein
MTKKNDQLKLIFSRSSFHCFQFMSFLSFHLDFLRFFFLAEPETPLIFSDTISLFSCPVHHSFPILTFFLAKLETPSVIISSSPSHYILPLNLFFVQCLIFSLPHKIQNEDLLSYSNTLTTFTSSQPNKILNENPINELANQVSSWSFQWMKSDPTSIVAALLPPSHLTQRRSDNESLPCFEWFTST